MRSIVWILVLLLFLAHQDSWNWTDDRLVLGMPIGLTYHIGLSIVVSLVWALACFFAWPDELDELDEMDIANEVKPDSSDSLEGGR